MRVLCPDSPPVVRQKARLESFFIMNWGEMNPSHFAATQERRKERERERKRRGSGSPKRRLEEKKNYFIS